MNSRTNGSLQRGAGLAVILLAASICSVSGGAMAADPTPTPAATKTPIVISNENLADYAAQGRVTSTGSSSGSSSGRERRPVHRSQSDGSKTVQDAVTDAPQIATDERRRHWVDKYTRQLDLVASIEDQIRVLDYEIPGLWTDFFNRDDPAYRDGVIKPKLDEALARSERLEKQLETEREMLAKIKVDARKDGAAPGWFRGIQKPTPRPMDEKHTDPGIIRD
jgi:hypothetical protein